MFTKNYISLSIRITWAVILIAAVFGIIPAHASGVIYYVKSNASGANNGSSWTNAYTDLQFALAAASSGDEIWVAAGTYKPVLSIERHHSFFLKNGVAIYGGFAGTETLRAQRDPSMNDTILSGDIGAVGDNSDNSYHVVVGENVDNTTMLDGFTITTGNANGDSLYNFDVGGGMYINNSNPTLADLVFIANSALNGGGIFAQGSLTLVRSTLRNNHADSDGGAIATSATIDLQSTTLYQNQAGNEGGAIYIASNSAIPTSIINSTLVQNQATRGGGVSVHGNSEISISNSTLVNNSAPITGGGIYLAGFVLGDIQKSLVICESSISSCVQGNSLNTSNSIISYGLPVDFGLATLGNYGGSTQTMALLPSSPAIDSGGDLNCPATDQRGVTRPQGSHCDIGAYEYQDLTPPTIVSSDPETEAINIPVDKAITITFDEAIDPATVNGNSVFLMPFNSNDPVPSNVSVVGNVVTLTPNDPLVIGTAYWLQVTSGVADLAGIMFGQFWLSSFTTGPNGFIDTTSSDFAAGTPSSCYISTIGNGEVNLQPLMGEEFSGTSLPGGWSKSGIGTVTVGNGVISIDNATAYYSTTTAIADHRLTFAATFSAGQFQKVGLVGNPDFSGQWAVFSTNNTTDKLYALTSDGQSTLLAGDFIGTKHTYEIIWQANSVYFFVDGLTATATRTVTLTDLRPMLSDSTADGQAVTVDWMHFTPYSSPCTFTSRIFDAGQMADWLNLGWSSGGSQGVACIASLPPNPPTCTPNYGFTMETRTGNTAVPDATWSNWQATNFAIASPNGRYLQYRATLSSDTPSATSRLYSVVSTFLEIPPTLILPGDTIRVTVDSSGGQGIGPSFGSSISADGRYVAFHSDAINLVPNDTNENIDVFIHDTQTGNTTRVSVDSNGVQSNGGSSAPAISADGRYVAFDSAATNLVPNDTNGNWDVFIHDMQTGNTTRVSIDSNGTESNGGSGSSSISADGRYVAFESEATNIVPDDTNGADDVFVHDLQTGNTRRVSVDSSGVQANGSSGDPYLWGGSAISADGRFIVFGSGATNLVPNDTNGSGDYFIHDMQTGATTRVSVDSSGAQSSNGCFFCYLWPPSISADGGYVA